MNRDADPIRVADTPISSDEALFEAVFARAPLLMSISTIEDGRYLDVNECFTRITGYSRAETIGVRSTDLGLITPRDRERLAAPVRESGRVVALPLQLKHKDGHPIFVKYWGEIVKLRGQPQLLSLATDATEEEAARAAARESDDRLRLIVDALPQFVSYLDRDLIYRFVNDKYTQIFKRPKDEIVGRPLPEIIGEAAFARTRENVQRALSGERVRLRGRVDYGDGKLIDLDGHMIPDFRPGGEVAGYFFVSSDVTDYLQTERALREALLWQETAVSAANVGFWDWYVPDERVVYSDEWKRQLGYEPHEISDGFHEWQSRLHPDDAEPTYARIQQFLKSCPEAYEVEFRMRHKDGSYRWIMARARVVERDAAGAAVRVMGSHIDITARKDTEARLEHERRLLEEAQRIGQIGSWEFDPQTGRSTWSHETFRQYGLDPEDGEPHYDDHRKFVHPDDWERFDAHVQRAVRDGVGYDIELRIVHGDGSMRYIVARCEPQRDLNGRVTRLVGTAHDITARKQVELDLARSLTDLRLAQRIARIGNWSFDPEVGRPVWSDIIYEIYERDPDCGTPDLAEYERMYAPEEYKHFITRFSAAVEHGQPYDITLRFTVNNRIKWIRAICEPEAEPGPAGYRLRGTIQDITHQKLLEDQLRQSQRMEAVGQLAGGVAHDFNNILTAILGYAELAAGELEADASDNLVYEALQQIREGGERAAGLTRQLLAFSRQQTSNPTVLTLNTVLQDMEKMLRRLLTENINLQIHCADDLAPVRADRTQIEQVVMNLVINARDAMPDGGTLAIHTANSDEQLTTEDANHTAVELRVRDTGCGMDRATLARIFEPFFSTKERGRGTGLGLATAYGIIQQANGEIRVDSELGQGTTFVVRLPATDAPVDADDDDHETSPSLRGTETILLAEDDDAVRELARQLLVHAGYKVLVAHTGTAALECIQRHPEPIHMLVTDVIMSAINGRDLAERVTASGRNIPVLFFSGYTADIVGKHGVLEPGIEFMQKPFTRTRLLTLVRQLLDGAGAAQ